MVSINYMYRGNPKRSRWATSWSANQVSAGISGPADCFIIIWRRYAAQVLGPGRVLCETDGASSQLQSVPQSWRKQRNYKSSITMDANCVDVDRVDDVADPAPE